MLGWLIKIFGSRNERELKQLQPLVAAINAREDAMRAKSDADLKAMTPYFKDKLDAGAGLEDILPEAFATVREASRRTLNMRPFDVQLLGGIVLHQGKVAEMKTGEGKTLVATMPVYLNALAGKGAHVVTVNDYLARRDAEWMGAIYRFLGLDVGVIIHGLDDAQRKENYQADITYGTNNEFGFDFLRDNMKFALQTTCRETSIMPSSTRWTPSSSTRHAHRSLFRGPPRSPPRNTMTPTTRSSTFCGDRMPRNSTRRTRRRTA